MSFPIPAAATYELPGPQAVGQVLGVQNSDRALENRFIFLKKATAEGKWKKSTSVKPLAHF